MYFHIGHLLGWFKSNDTPLEYRYKVKVNNEISLLDLFLTNLWLHIKAGKSDNSVFFDVKDMLAKAQYALVNEQSLLDLINELIKRRVLIHVNSNEELYNNIKNLIAIRNGLPFYEPEAMNTKNELKSVLLIDEITPISNENLEVWEKADGTKTIAEIYNDCNHMSFTNFIENLIYLKNINAIFIG